MRYLKLYEEMELVNQMRQRDIEDILLEVKDIGYSVIIEENFKNSIITSNRNNDNIYFLKIYKNTRNVEIPISFNEIKDCVLRIKDYLGDGYIRCHTYSTYHQLDLLRTNWQTVELNEDTTIDYEFKLLCIEFLW